MFIGYCVLDTILGTSKIAESRIIKSLILSSLDSSGSGVS